MKLRALLALSILFSGRLSADPSENLIEVAVSGDVALWGAFNQETPASLDKAEKSYFEVSDAWKLEIKSLLGPKLKYVDLGQATLYKMGPTVYREQTQLYDSFLIGNVQSSLAKILVNVPTGFHLAHYDGAQLSGKSAAFDLNDFKSVTAAYAVALETYKKKCSDWRAQAAKDFDSSFVYASCGDIVKGDTPYISDNPSNAWQMKFQFSSNPKIYYFRSI